MIVGHRMSHPRVLVSVCIDGGRTPGAALLVVRTNPKRGARFELDRRSFGSAETRGTVIASIAERIPRDATVLAHTKRLSDHALRHSAILGRVATARSPNADHGLPARSQDDLPAVRTTRTFRCGGSLWDRRRERSHVDEAGSQGRTRCAGALASLPVDPLQGEAARLVGRGMGSVARIERARKAPS